MKIKTAELIGAALDWAVAKGEGWTNYPTDSIEQGQVWHCEPEQAPFGRTIRRVDYSPSTDWAQGGPIIEREIVDLRARNNTWVACAEIETADGDWIIPHYVETYGPTPLIAAMRCYVASKLGDEVELPDELLP